MPSTSKKQHNFMAAVANNPSFAKKAGVPQSVGKDFAEADKGKKFSKGGANPQPKQQSINQPKTNHGEQAFFKQGGSMASKMNPGFMAMMAKKKDAKPMGKPTMKAGMSTAKDGMKKPTPMAGMMGMKKGGMKKMADGGMTMVEKGGKMVPDFAADGKGKMNKGGMAYAKGGGIESKGKTKGTMVKMNKGGMKSGGMSKKYC